MLDEAIELEKKGMLPTIKAEFRYYKTVKKEEPRYEREPGDEG